MGINKWKYQFPAKWQQNFDIFWSFDRLLAVQQYNRAQNTFPKCLKYCMGLAQTIPYIISNYINYVHHFAQNGCPKLVR